VIIKLVREIMGWALRVFIPLFPSIFIESGSLPGVKQFLEVGHGRKI
jgi:hypothetical protein